MNTRISYTDEKTGKALMGGRLKMTESLTEQDNSGILGHMHKLNCVICGDQFKASRPNRKTCSKKCRKKYNEKFYKGRSSKYNYLHTGVVGAIAEIKVSADLLIKGFDVYRSVSPCNKGDLIAKRKAEIFSIEVRNGYRNGFNDKIISNLIIKEPIDVFAIYISHEDKIIYYDAKSCPLTGNLSENDCIWAHMGETLKKELRENEQGKG